MSGAGFGKPLTVKKNPVVIVKTFIVLQLTTVAVFFLSGVLFDYGEIYDHLPLPTSFSYHIVEAIAIFTLETILVFYIFFRWHKEYYNIEKDKVVYGRGMIVRRQTAIPLSTISSITYRQGPLGRLTKYGRIELISKNTESKFIMDHIPDPQSYVEFLIRLRDAAGPSSLEGSRRLIADLISEGEHEGLEFKSSFRWDFNQGKVNKNLEKAVMKTIVAFLNSNGGRLIVGVDDDGHVIGLDQDFGSLPKPNADGFQNHFNNVFGSMIGVEFRQFVKLAIEKKDGKDCCLIEVMPSAQPAYLRIDNGEEFFIRTGNGTTSLKLSEASSYISSHWKGRLL